MDELKVVYEGSPYTLWELSREKLMKIWEEHCKRFSGPELDFVLCSHDPLPPNDLFALTLRAVDRMLAIRELTAQEEEEEKRAGYDSKRGILFF